MLSLEQLRNPSDAEIAGFDLAEVDLSLAVGLPGAERLAVAACLDWIDRAADWVRRDTAGTIHQFRDDPAAFDHCEGIFRIVSMMSVLKRGLGVRYNPERAGDLSTWTDSRDVFLHGIIAGQGGTCSSLPVLFAAVGRRLGYPIRLVSTPRHLFNRWDDPAGERFNFDISGNGLNTHPDDFYRTWPVPMREMPWSWRMRFLHSLTPREELTDGWRKRAGILHANGWSREAVKASAIAWSLAPENYLLEYLFANALQGWREGLMKTVPPDWPRPEVVIESQWYPGLILAIEQDIVVLDAIQTSLESSSRRFNLARIPARITIPGPRPTRTT